MLQRYPNGLVHWGHRKGKTAGGELALRREKPEGPANDWPLRPPLDLEQSCKVLST